MRFDVSGVDHLCVGGSSASSERAKQVVPNTALGPANETVVDRRRRAILRRTVAPAAAALQNMNDAADHTTVIHALLSAHIRRQMRLNSLPLLVAQQEQVLAHDTDLSLERIKSVSYCFADRTIGFSP